MRNTLHRTSAPNRGAQVDPGSAERHLRAPPRDARLATSRLRRYARPLICRSGIPTAWRSLHPEVPGKSDLLGQSLVVPLLRGRTQSTSPALAGGYR